MSLVIEAFIIEYYHLDVWERQDVIFKDNGIYYYAIPILINRCLGEEIGEIKKTSVD